MRSVPSYRAPTPALVLLVDDNCDGTAARCSVLGELGYTVVTACSGQEALKRIEQQNFDLVITDYRMSPMDGVELIQNLRSRNFRNPIILLTGFAENLGLNSENTGADVVLQKCSNEISNLIRHSKRLLSPPKKPAGSYNPRKLRPHPQAAETDS